MQVELPRLAISRLGSLQYDDCTQPTAGHDASIFIWNQQRVKVTTKIFLIHPFACGLRYANNNQLISSNRDFQRNPRVSIMRTLSLWVRCHSISSVGAFVAQHKAFHLGALGLRKQQILLFQMLQSHKVSALSCRSDTAAGERCWSIGYSTRLQ